MAEAATRRKNLLRGGKVRFAIITANCAECSRAPFVVGPFGFGVGCVGSFGGRQQPVPRSCRTRHTDAPALGMTMVSAVSLVA